MRWAIVLSIAVVALVVAGCADAAGSNLRPTITVAGLISDSTAQPIPNTDVTVRSYAPNSCATGSSIQQVDAKTNTNGIYRVELVSLVATYSACIRVTVGTTSRDTTVLNVPQYGTVQVNVTVP
ncbi:MAG TPA: hypothetical protein VGU74_17010 [Gemmatimonadales bacterium]|nr:hypothetical protein [Gemmatimonadales bacterium]